MHPVLGTMMPEICEAPRLPEIPFIHHCPPYLMVGDAFILFSGEWADGIHKVTNLFQQLPH